MAIPQLQAAWAREAVAKVKARLGNGWQSALVAEARDGSPAEQIRALTLLCQFGPRPTTELFVLLETSGPASEPPAGGSSASENRRQ